MKNQFKAGDRVAYSSKFLRSVADYSHQSAAMRGTVTEVKEIRGAKFPLVKIKWDGVEDELRSGAMACNLTLVSRIPADSVA